MKWPALISIAVVVVVVAIWVILFKKSDKRPEIMPALVGCYTSEAQGNIQKMEVTKSGLLKFGKQNTIVVPYEDKQSLSLFPSLKVISGKRGGIQFVAGNPMLLRIDADKQGFVVPSENGESVWFRKSTC